MLACALGMNNEYLSAPLALWEIVGHKCTSFRFTAPPKVAPKGKGDKGDDRAVTKDGSLIRDAFVKVQGL